MRFSFPARYDQTGVRMINESLFSSETPEHYTPRSIVDHVIRVLGAIDLDPCSNSRECPNVPASSHFTPTENGLSRPWFGRVYMNPPYGREIGDWVRKLVSEFRAGNVSAAVALVPARTDTYWFGEIYGFPVCFVRGRLRFLDRERNPQGSAPFPSAIVYLGNERERFYSVFENLGDIYIPRSARSIRRKGGSHD